MRLLLSDVAAAVGGVHHGGPIAVDGATIDSRAVIGGELFVPIVAERDGHDFIAEAVERGVSAWLASRDVGVPGAWVEVDDTAAALLAVGRLARGHLPERVIAVTGSVGKTTVKDLAAAAVAGSFNTHASTRSFNNELGVPITLAGAPASTEAVVVEMGARARGHIALLCGVARPTIGVVTVVALAHAETFATIDEVARAKGELIETLPATGTAVLNIDDARVVGMRDRTEARALLYGMASGADVTAADVVIDDELRARFTLRSPWGDAPVHLEVRGAHQVTSALAAAAAALAAGAELESVAAGLGEAAAAPHRMALQRAASGALVLDDAYNANATSVAAALHALVALPARRHVAVLGVMAELGDGGPAEHRRMRALAEALGIELVAVDTDLYGVEPVTSIDAAVEALGALGDGDAVLVKASRIARLERVAEALIDSDGQSA
ncbi:MAG: UDP-N-acetylmuramoyl-tripeptide--D-alanyl-D-alanine ligase [Acidimicrobiales bacterium]